MHINCHANKVIFFIKVSLVMFKKVFTPSICNIAKDISGELLFISRFLYVDFFFFFFPGQK